MGDTSIHGTPEQAAFAEVWMFAAELATRDGATPLNALPEPWHRQVGRWELWVNGSSTPTKVKGDVTIEPFHMYVEFNGWPAGILNPYSGTIAAGEAANIQTFRDALQAEARP